MKIPGADVDLLEVFRRPCNVAGIQTQHSFAELMLLGQLLDYCQPSVVIEIGTAAGGLSVFLSTWSKAQYARFYTLDILDQRSEHMRHESEIRFRKMDALSDEARAYLDGERDRLRTLIYCDGGDKFEELLHYAQTLKPGDIIACHDWGTEVVDFDATMYEESFNLRRLWPEVFDAHHSLQAAWQRKA